MSSLMNTVVVKEDTIINSLDKQSINIIVILIKIFSYFIVLIYSMRNYILRKGIEKVTP